MLLDLYISELCDFQETGPSFSEQKQPFLRHGDFTNAMGSLDTGGQLVDTLIIVKSVNDIRGQVDILCFSFHLFPECVEDSEKFRVHLLWLTSDRGVCIRN